MMRGSSLIRGEQIADFLGAKKNPISGFENDICIFVKPHTNNYESLPKNSYVDLIDSKYYVDKLFNRPDLKLIVTSLPAYRGVKQMLTENEVFYIPQHHCNFERIKQENVEIKSVGFIGSPRNFQLNIEEFTKKCSKLGLKFLYKIDYKGRKHVCDFYHQIDVQLDWRPKSEANNPLKIINAASFGIPTIAFPKQGFEEMDGFYLKAGSIDKIFEVLLNLKESNSVYNDLAKGGIVKAEEYHIENIAKLYNKLR